MTNVPTAASVSGAASSSHINGRNPMMAECRFTTETSAWAAAHAAWDALPVLFTLSRFLKRNGCRLPPVSSDGKRHASRIWEWGNRKKLRIADLRLRINQSLLKYPIRNRKSSPDSYRDRNSSYFPIPIFFIRASSHPMKLEAT